MSGKTYRDGKEKLLEILSADEIKMLKKDYPFRQERNAKIYELRRKGIKCAVLMELTGLCKNSIIQIGQFGRNHPPLMKSNQNREDDLIKINTAFKVFFGEIKKILKKRRN